jgi:hypothetical protein
MTTAADLSTTHRTIYGYSTGRDTTAGEKGIETIPLAYGLGLAYRIGSRIIVSGDVYTQDWQNLKSNGITVSDVRRSVRYAIGGEYVPSPEPGVSFIDHISYQAGFAYNQTYYQIQGEPIDEISFSAGFSIPIIYDTKLSIASEYLIRGTTKQVIDPGSSVPIQFVKDKIFRLNFELGLGELWFVQSSDE